VSAAVAALGTALFVYAVRQAGVAEILDGVARVGWGLLAIVALGGLRFALRTECWRLCLRDRARLRFRDALPAFLAGDAVGSVTPFGLLASEPTKVLLTSHRLATADSVASLTLENLLYSGSVLAMVTLGASILLITTPLPSPLLQVVLGCLAVGVGGMLLLLVLVRMRGVGTWLTGRWPRVGGLITIVRDVRQFAQVEPGRLAAVFTLDLVYHALAVVEVFITLRWLTASGGPTLAMAIVFEALNRVVTVVFKFVPFRVGVDEALTGALAAVVALDPAAGVALAIVRKVRSLFWAAVGLAAIAAHPTRSGQQPTPGIG
jgi:hypothetical protein